MGSVTTHVRKIPSMHDYSMTASVKSQAFSFLYFPAFLHKGIVLNVEDFKGPIEFRGCTIQKNFIFIKDTLNGEIAKDTYKTYDIS